LCSFSSPSTRRSTNPMFLLTASHPSPPFACPLTQSLILMLSTSHTQFTSQSPHPPTHPHLSYNPLNHSVLTHIPACLL
jgi:hypothetical protein